MKQLANWQLLRSSLQQHIPCMLLYVLESKGSSPGRQGFFMTVNAAGDMSGSLGGGIMEHKLVERAFATMRNRETLHTLIPQYHQKKAAEYKSGMICSGAQWIWIQTINSSDAEWIDTLINDLQQHQSGTLQINPGGCSYIRRQPEQAFYFQRNSADDFEYREKTGYHQVLHIVGGGHCALALSKCMSDMDFYIYLYETRPELNTLLKNTYAHSIIHVNNYSEITKYIQPGNHVYVVIMTFGYRTDDEALRAILHQPFKYLGVMGSKHKMKTLFNEYKTNGVSEASLESIYTPIGLPIQSKTPEEIAISIAAEIISVKNGAQQ